MQIRAEVLASCRMGVSCIITCVFRRWKEVACNLARIALRKVLFKKDRLYSFTSRRWKSAALEYTYTMNETSNRADETRALQIWLLPVVEFSVDVGYTVYATKMVVRDWTSLFSTSEWKTWHDVHVMRQLVKSLWSQMRKCQEQLVIEILSQTRLISSIWTKDDAVNARFSRRVQRRLRRAIYWNPTNY
jgi:hypothetical protein